MAVGLIVDSHLFVYLDKHLSTLTYSYTAQNLCPTKEPITKLEIIWQEVRERLEKGRLTMHTN